VIQCLVVCEAAADCRTVTALADRVLLAEVDWLDGVLDVSRLWRGLDDIEGFVPIKSIKDRAQKARLRVHGRYEGHTGEYLQLRKVLKLIGYLLPDAHAVVFVRDDDGKGLRDAVEAARTEDAAREAVHRSGPAVVLAVPTPEMEAWHLVGFVAADEAERVRHTEMHAELGCDPCTQAHTLNPKADHVRRGTKRVLNHLVDNDAERRERCLSEPSLADLAAKGVEVGLTAFLDEVRSILAPVFLKPAS
jgi:hypothetical protein